MRSQYPSPRARWVLFLAAVLFGVVSGAAPAIHFAEGGTSGGLDLASSASERSVPGGHPDIPGPHGPDDLDCFYCQVLTSPAHPGPPPVASGELDLKLYSYPRQRQSSFKAPFQVLGARAPPHV